MEHAEEALGISGRYGMAYWLVTSRILSALAKAELDDRKEGIARAKKALRAYVASGPSLMYPYWLSVIAELQAGETDPHDSLALVDEGQTCVQATDERWPEAELHRLRGELLLSDKTKSSSEGEACFQLALDTAREQGCKAYELRAAISLYRCRAADGKRDKKARARRLLGEVYDSFSEGFDLPDLRSAADLLDRLK